MVANDRTLAHIAELEALLGAKEEADGWADGPGSRLHSFGLEADPEGSDVCQGDSVSRSSSNGAPVGRLSGAAGQEGIESGDGDALKGSPEHVVLSAYLFWRQPACPVCPRVCSGRSSLKAHYLAVHLKQRRFRCGRAGCRRAFFERNKLRRHVMHVHEGRRRFPCSRCSVVFKDKSDRERHESSQHDGLRPYVCQLPRCRRAFSRPYALKDHCRRVHGFCLRSPQRR